LSPIGIFDSGYGGLTIFRQIRQLMPQYDYLYLGDNARAPYGPRSFEVVYEFTLQAVRHLFDCGCPLIILACNTASAKALRTIQQHDLPLINANTLINGNNNGNNNGNDNENNNGNDNVNVNSSNAVATSLSTGQAVPVSVPVPVEKVPVSVPVETVPVNVETVPVNVPVKKNVLGVVRPTVEAVPALTTTRHIGVMATEGTIRSNTYTLELAKLAPDIVVTGQACPMWVPLIENGEADSPGADYFVRQYIDQLLQRDPLIDAIILGCTHYPLLINKIRQYTPAHIHLIPQGEYVARSLADYLRRHTDMEASITRGATARFLTTEHPDSFAASATRFLDQPIHAEHTTLNA